MKNLIFILLLPFLVLESCSFFGKSDNHKIGVKIKSGQIGDYKIGDKINNLQPENNQTFSTVDYVNSKGEAESVIFIKDNTLNMVKLIVSGNAIREIEAFSPLYKTEAGIGTGNSLNQLIETYPDIKLIYSTELLNFQAVTGQLKNVIFLINPEMYKGDESIFSAQGEILLKADDFQKEAKIVSIKIY
jgi:hypothetical protein